MSGHVERGGRTDLRQRRAFQKLAADALGTLGLLAGSGITFDPDTGTINVGLGTNSGLHFVSNLLSIDLRDTDPGLELVASGIGVLLAVSNPYLSNTGGLHVDLTALSAAITSLPNLITVGTIGTGVWQGTVITGQYGGTGVNNSGKTITLGGNLTTAGTFATTITSTATTNSTLPAGTHTLAAIDLAQSWTAAQTFGNNNLLVRNPANTFSGTINAAAITSARTWTFPNTAGTVALLSAQTFTGAQTFNGTVSFNNSVTFGGTAGIQVFGPSSFAGTSATVTPLTVQGTTGQSVPLQQWTDDVGPNTLAAIGTVGDLYFTASTRGICLQSPNAHYWRASISNLGILTWTDIGTTAP